VNDQNLKACRVPPQDVLIERERPVGHRITLNTYATDGIPLGRFYFDLNLWERVGFYLNVGVDQEGFIETLPGPTLKVGAPLL
jgi:hypothetical protein